MTDKELADWIIKDGMFEMDRLYDGQLYYMVRDNFLDASGFVRDWRVAGALMEKVDKFCAGTCKNCILVSVDNNETLSFETKSLPRAIIEACVEALSD